MIEKYTFNISYISGDCWELQAYRATSQRLLYCQSSWPLHRELWLQTCTLWHSLSLIWYLTCGLIFRDTGGMSILFNFNLRFVFRLFLILILWVRSKSETNTHTFPKHFPYNHHTSGNLCTMYEYMQHFWTSMNPLCLRLGHMYHQILDKRMKV